MCLPYSLFSLDPIDLTKDGGDQDMQKALMLSMQEMQSTTGGGVISLEEQELSRSISGWELKYDSKLTVEYSVYI